MPTQLITSPNIIIKVLYFFYEKFTQDTLPESYTHKPNKRVYLIQNNN